MKLTTTSAPAASSAMTISRPIPRLAPVTSAIRSDRSSIWQPRLSTFGACNRQRVSLDELDLMPVGIHRRRFAGLIELRYLFYGQIPADRAEILPELIFVARTDDDTGNGGALQQPIQRDLRHRFAGFRRQRIECINHFEKMLLRHFRPGIDRCFRTEPGRKCRRSIFSKWLM